MRGALDVWFLTRPGLTVPRLGLPTLQIPDRVSGDVRYAAPGSSYLEVPPEFGLDLRELHWVYDRVLGVGANGEVLTNTQEIHFELAGVDLSSGMIRVFESCTFYELSVVATAPDGRVLLGSDCEGLLMYDPGGRVELHLYPVIETEKEITFERPAEGQAFWDQYGGAWDLSCGPDTFIVLVEDGRWGPGGDPRTEGAWRIDRYTYGGKLVRSHRVHEWPFPADGPHFDYICLDRQDRLWAASREGAIALFSPDFKPLFQIHLEELPGMPPDLTEIHWFGVDSRCRPWIYQETTGEPKQLICAGFDLGLGD